MRKSAFFFLFLSLCAALLGALSLHAAYQQRAMAPLLSLQAEQVRGFGLTDLCLFTEAQYTRHISQSDLHTPFQDHPLSFEHFPSGSLVAVPREVR
jgi:hypothetical protein